MTMFGRVPALSTTEARAGELGKPEAPLTRTVRVGFGPLADFTRSFGRRSASRPADVTRFACMTDLCPMEAAGYSVEIGYVARTQFRTNQS